MVRVAALDKNGATIDQWLRPQRHNGNSDMRDYANTRGKCLVDDTTREVISWVRYQCALHRNVACVRSTDALCAFRGRVHRQDLRAMRKHLGR
jgi:hypothetical protein